MNGQPILLAIAALWGLLGVVFLAAGAHGVYPGILSTGGQVLLFHAATVLALLNTQLVSGWRRAAPIALMLTGSGLFALEVALHAFTGVTALGFLAPIGGGVTILGWLTLIIGALTQSKP